MISRNQTYALLAGTAVGAAIAILYAPQSGEATRKAILKELNGVGDRLSEAGEYLRAQADNLNAQAQATIDHTRHQVLDVLDHATSTVNATLGEAGKTFSATLDKASTAIATAVNTAAGR